MVFGIPDEAVMGAVGALVLLVVGLKFLGGKKPPGAPQQRTVEPEATGVAPEEHTGLNDLLDKPGFTQLPSEETIEEEEEAGMSVQTNSLEALLARPIDEAPSLGDETKTNVDDGLGLIKFEGSVKKEPEAVLPPEMKDPDVPKKKEKPIPKTAKSLLKLKEQFGEEFDIDEVGDIVAVPEERPAYTPPKDLKKKAEKEVSQERPVRLYDKPKEKRTENLKRYCMLQYDKGENPKKVEQLLRVKGANRTESKKLSFKMYRIWIEKREPVIREIKEKRDMIKRVEYKFLKQQIDGVARKKTINEANMKIAELESKLKSSEDYFN